MRPCFCSTLRYRWNCSGLMPSEMPIGSQKPAGAWAPSAFWYWLFGDAASCGRWPRRRGALERRGDRQAERERRGLGHGHVCAGGSGRLFSLSRRLASSRSPPRGRGHGRRWRFRRLPPRDAPKRRPFGASAGVTGRPSESARRAVTARRELGASSRDATCAAQQWQAQTAR